MIAKGKLQMAPGFCGRAERRASFELSSWDTGIGGQSPLPVWFANQLFRDFGLVIRSDRTRGRRIYAIGNRESAVYLSGIDTRRVILIFAISGSYSALYGVLLAGYSTHAYQAMDDLDLLPATTALALGGTKILDGSGTFLGTIAGVTLITLLQSILSVVQMPRLAEKSFAELSSSRCCCCTGGSAWAAEERYRKPIGGYEPGPNNIHWLIIGSAVAERHSLPRYVVLQSYH
jgi:ribose/xylose/arabinose/galactoside ABC-type transport system permease subunit